MSRLAVAKPANPKHFANLSRLIDHFRVLKRAMSRLQGKKAKWKYSCAFSKFE
jgi:hypothetical protein